MREALEAYLADLPRHGRPDTAREAEGRFKTVIYDDFTEHNRWQFNHVCAKVTIADVHRSGAERIQQLNRNSRRRGEKLNTIIY